MTIKKEAEMCNLCPRNCSIDRKEQIGFCKVGSRSHVARCALHMWEEPFISGKNGSGTVFFCGCNLRCVFCQNHEISTCGTMQNAVPTDENSLPRLMLSLQEQGAHNINFVTPTPHVPLIVDSVKRARDAGLYIPIVFNTNSYINVSTLKMLDGLVDIYLPDLKYVTPALARMISGAEDYPRYALSAIDEMYRQCGKLTFDENGMAKSGIALRHLVLPGNIDETRRVLDTIAAKYPLDINISLMSQYFPAHKAMEMPPFDRKLLPREYKRAVDHAYSLGFTNILTQEMTSAEASFVPAWGEVRL